MPGWQERVVVAYLDEPPFGLPAPPGARPSGCDMDVAHHVLAAIGAPAVDYALTTFPELIPGLLDGRWHMATPIFVTGEHYRLHVFGTKGSLEIRGETELFARGLEGQRERIP